MEQPHNRYHSFLIRFWLEDWDDNLAEDWRIELESIYSGQKCRFPDLDTMLDFFREQIDIPQIE